MKKINFKKWDDISENNKIVLKNVMGAFLVKGLGVIVSLFTMPAYIRFFNNDIVLGLWFTVLSVLHWILNFDFGIGNGLRNHLSEELAKNNILKAKKYISSAYVSIGIVCALVIIVFTGIFHFIDWNKVFNIEEHLVSKTALAVSVFIVFIGIAIQLFLKIISSVFYAMQKSSMNNLLSLVTTVTTLSLVFLWPQKNNDINMISMAIIHTLAVILPLLCATVFVFGFSKTKNIRPKLKYFSKECAKKVLSLGGMFFFVQIAYMLIMNTNEYYITLFSGSENVVEYQIYYKLFTLGSMVFTLAITPIWSIVTKAAAQGDLDWLKKLYKRMLKFGILGVGCEFLIIPFLQFGINVWLKEEAITVNYYYAFTFALVGSLMIFSGIFSSITNGLGKLKIQTIFFALGAIVKIPLSIFLVELTGGWIGVLIASVIVMSFYCIAEPIWINKYIKKEMKI